jgi:drug/metabolite transporter (DMT)-like permease
MIAVLEEMEANGTESDGTSANYTRRGACDNQRVFSPPSRARRAFANPYLLLALTPLFWSFNWIFGRGLAADIPPMTMAFLRWFFAVLILAPIAIPHVRRDWPIVRRHWKTMLFLGVIGVGTHNVLAYAGLNHTTATNGVILNSFIPVMIIALSWIFLRERLTGLQLVGVGVSLSGVLAILGQGRLDVLLSFRLNVGDLLIILSMAMWAVYTICLRWRPAGLNLLTFLFVLACVGDLSVLPLFLAELAFGRHMAVTVANVAALVSVALFSSVLAYIFWNRGVEEVGANVAGLFVHLMPVFGVVLAWVFLGERLAGYHLVGIALILAGIYITSRLGRRTPVPVVMD